MKIVVPSRGREDRVFALDYIPLELDPILCVPVREQRRYARYHPNVEILPYSKGGTIATKRQWILEKVDTDVVFFVDDDCKFFLRPSMNSPKLIKLTNPLSMWRKMQATFKKFPLVSISYRSGNNNLKTRYRINGKANGAWGVHKPTLEKHNIRIDTLPIMEDYYTTLSLLTRGYCNCVWYKWAWNQFSNSRGGCSEWRTLELQNETAIKLAKLFPDYVKNVVKCPPFGLFANQERVDVRVQWRKAYEKSRVHPKYGQS